MYYTIKQMAEMFDVTEHTLRFYTDKVFFHVSVTVATEGYLMKNPSIGCRGLSA